MLIIIAIILGQAVVTQPSALAFDEVVAISHQRTGEVKPPVGHQVVLSIDDGHRSVYQTVYPLLKRYQMTATIAVIVNTLTGQRLDYRAIGNFYYITRGEIKEMIDSCKIEIASHSLSHPWLTQLDSVRAWEEIYRSRVVLESLFGVGVVTFVYPYGDMNSRVRKLVERAGYRAARAVRQDEVNFWLDRYRLPVFELRNGVALESVKIYVLNHQVSILLLHRIVAKPRVFTEWSAKEFAELLAWLDEIGVKTVRLADLYYDWRRDVVGKLITESRSGLDLVDADSLFKYVDIDATRTFHPR